MSVLLNALPKYLGQWTRFVERCDPNVPRYYKKLGNSQNEAARVMNMIERFDVTIEAQAFFKRLKTDNGWSAASLGSQAAMDARRYEKVCEFAQTKVPSGQGWWG